MPLPLAPIGGLALRATLVAAAGYLAGRRIERGFRDQRAEDALDDLNEGLAARRDDGQLNLDARYRRRIRLGEAGPGIEIDFASLSRLRIRRIGPEG